MDEWDISAGEESGDIIKDLEVASRKHALFGRTRSTYHKYFIQDLGKCPLLVGQQICLQ